MTKEHGIVGTPDKNGIIWQKGTIRVDGKRRQMWAVKDATTGVATQGQTKEEARANLNEAVSLYNSVANQTT